MNPRVLRRRAFLVSAVILCAALTATRVSAHAELVRSDPAANAVLTRAPLRVELFFSEAIDGSLSSASVLDSSGKAVDLHDAHVDEADPTRMTVSLHPLEDGLYTVIWKAFSTDDGHLETGSYSFSVGAANAGALPADTQQSNTRVPVSGVISKWLLLMSLALLVGQGSFASLVWKPTLAASAEALPIEVQQPRLWERLVRIALVGMFLGLLLSIASEAGQINGVELAWPFGEKVGGLLINSRVGVIWLARLGLALGSLWLLESRAAAWKSWAAFAAGLALLLTLSLTSHAAGGRRPLLPVVADWIHAAGASFWLGGLPHLFGGLRLLRKLPAESRTRLMSVCVEKFSRMALISVAAIAATGLFAAFLRVGTLQALLATLYGRTLVLKQFIFGLLLVLAAINLLWLSPRINPGRKSHAEAAAYLGRSVLAEMTLGVLLLMSVALLTYLPPANARPPGEVTQVARVRDLKIALDISPGTLGTNSFVVQLASNGQPVDAVQGVTLLINPVDHDAPQAQVPLQPEGGGSYSGEGNYLTFTGRWQAQVIVQRSGKDESVGSFHFSLPSASPNTAGTMRMAAAILIILDGVLLAFVVVTLAGGSGGEKGVSPAA